MKRLFVSVLALTVLVGAEQAEANWFWQKDTNNNEIHAQQRPMKSAAYTSSENQKWVYNGNNGYRSNAGQLAVEDRMNDGDNTAFVVHPTRGSRLGASLRQGDTGASMDTRLNGAFNN